MSVAIKICCISSLAEARLALGCGASALGLVSNMPSGPGVISEERIAAIAAELAADTEAFLLTCLQEAKSLIAQQRRCGVGTLQLCDRVEQETERTAQAGVVVNDMDDTVFRLMVHGRVVRRRSACPGRPGSVRPTGGRRGLR